MNSQLDLKLVPRRCPLCGSTDDSRVLAPSTVDLDRLDRSAFASRKSPELMHHRLIACPTCDLVYASPAPERDSLLDAYRDADYDSAEEARYAAATYARLLGEFRSTLPDGGALDIGAGDGAFLGELLRAGFDDVVGIEPSEAPVRAAPPELRRLIRPELFAPGQFEPGRFALVSCLQTLEHVTDPLELCSEAHALLAPGGAFLGICHDRRALVNRLLGRYSPILDVEHLQLFSPRSLRELLRRAGFEHVAIRAFANRYPVGYWLRLAPVPRVVAEWGRRVPGALTLPVGNLVAVARR